MRFIYLVGIKFKSVHFYGQKLQLRKEVEVAKMHYKLTMDLPCLYVQKSKNITKRKYPISFVEIGFKQFPPKQVDEKIIFSILEASMKSSREDKNFQNFQG